METSETEIIESTKKWVREIVVGLNFCPFAAKPFHADLIEYRVDDSVDLEASLVIFIASCHYLKNNPELETGLVIYSQGYTDFDSYLNLVELAEKLLIVEGFEGIYQVASFHPNYLFAGSEEKDPANYTNRSPYPMLHILREDLLEIAIEKHVDVDAIPDQNIEKANQLGLEYFKKLKF